MCTDTGERERECVVSIRAMKIFQRYIVYSTENKRKTNNEKFHKLYKIKGK